VWPLSDKWVVCFGVKGSKWRAGYKCACGGECILEEKRHHGIELLRGCAVEKCPALCQQAVCIDVRACVVLRQLMCRQEQRKWIQRWAKTRSNACTGKEWPCKASESQRERERQWVTIPWDRRTHSMKRQHFKTNHYLHHTGYRIIHLAALLYKAIGV